MGVEVVTDGVEVVVTVGVVTVGVEDVDIGVVELVEVVHEGSCSIQRRAKKKYLGPLMLKITFTWGACVVEMIV